MAKLSGQAKRCEEMVEFTEKVVSSADGEELSVEKRNLLSVTYKNVIGAGCASWMIISVIEQKEESRVSALKATDRRSMSVVICSIHLYRRSGIHLSRHLHLGRNVAFFKFGTGKDSDQVEEAAEKLEITVMVNFLKISFAAKETDLVDWKGDILAIGVTEKGLGER